MDKEYFNRKYYTDRLTYKVGEVVMYRGTKWTIVQDFMDGNVNLQNKMEWIITRVPKMFLYKL